MIRDLPETPLVAAIEHELTHHCRGFPAKRAALRLVLTLLSPRNTPWDLWQALSDVNEIGERLRRAKVV